MNEHTYKSIELTGTSAKSVEEAVNNAIQKASETVRNMRWFTMEEVRGVIDGGMVRQWQVTVKVGFTLDE
jgi:flavin-binding protein dodecin